MPLVALGSFVVIAPLDLLILMLFPLSETVEQEIEQAVGRGLDGVIVYVNQQGRPPEYYSAGWKDKLSLEPADPQALFKIGSIHKMYLAVAVAKLASDGILSLEDTLAHQLPGLREKFEFADQITIRMLVGHRSGLPDFINDENFDWFHPEIGSGDILDLVYGDQADFAPNAEYGYSNTNYVLVGRILDKVLGYSHHRYVYEEILHPLGLTNTFFSIDEVESGDVMSGYWYGYDDDLRYLGGSMLSTAEDVGLFVKALVEGTLLSAKEQDLYAGIYVFEHTGWVPGYYSIVRFDDQTRAVVVQFVSTTGGETWGTAGVVGGKAAGMANILFERILRTLEPLPELGQGS